MALTGTQAYAISRKYTADTAEGMGAVKGKNCTVQNIQDIRDASGNLIGHIIQFQWTEDDGTIQTAQMQLMDGKDSFEQGYYDSVHDKFYLDSQFTKLIEGDTDKMYMTLDTNRLYWFSGTGYIDMTGSGSRPDIIPISYIDSLFS